jgi:hypothetical protein
MIIYKIINKKINLLIFLNYNMINMADFHLKTIMNVLMAIIIAEFLVAFQNLVVKMDGIDTEIKFIHKFQ